MKLTLLLKSDEPITFLADDKVKVLSLLSQWMSQNDGLIRKPAACDGLAFVVTEDGDDIETVTFEYIEFYSGSKTQYCISSGYTGSEPYEVERFWENWYTARERFLELALKHGQWEE